jgi:hypothetical protein
MSYVGLVPKESRIRDRVCFLAGGSVPYILRPSVEGSSYQFVGDWDVQGLMHGEALMLRQKIQPLRHKSPEDLQQTLTTKEIEQRRELEQQVICSQDLETDGCDWDILLLR